MSDWQIKNQKLYKKFTFKDFQQAFEFMIQVSQLAQQQQHHPEWRNDYNVVEIWLTTHDAGDQVTNADHLLAKSIDGLAEPSKNSETAKVEEKNTTTITDKENVYKLYTDGGSRGNPGPSAGAYVILDGQDKLIEQDGYYLGITTNNQAEYQALRRGMERAAELGIARIQIFLDSLLVVNQMKGLYKIKNAELRPIYDDAKDFSVNFKSVTYNHVPRELNKKADAEVNRLLDKEAARNK